MLSKDYWKMETMRKRSNRYLSENEADHKYFKKIEAINNINDMATVMCDFQLQEIENDCERCPVKKYCSVGRSGFLSFAED